MSAETLGLIVIAILLVFLVMGNWVFVALGVAGLIGLYFSTSGNMAIIGATLWKSLNTSALCAIPLFIFMGEVCLKSGMASSLYTQVGKWFTRIPGGLLHSNVVASSIFAAISGSMIATAVTIGTVAIPEQRKLGYDKRMVMGSIGAAGGLGILIPPSINMIVYGTWVRTSIAHLFMAGLIPGIILALFYSTYIGLRSLRNPKLAPQISATWKERFRGIKGMAPLVILMLTILISIYTGFMTPTETAGFSAGIAIVFAFLLRKLSIGLIREATLSAVRISAMILGIYVSASVLVLALNIIGMPVVIAEWVAAAGFGTYQLLAAIFVMYLILGCLMEALAMILFTLPFVYPIIIALGFDPIWFGVILVMMCEMAAITPPVGLMLYIVVGITKEETSLTEAVQALIPYVAIQILLVVLIVAFPNIALFLPGTMKK